MRLPPEAAVGACQGARSHLAAWACATLLGCSDGYPTADAPRFEPHRMSQAERLRHLNEIGAAAAASGRWRFGLASGCMLRVEHRAAWWRGTRFEVALPRASSIRMRYDKATETFDVVAQRPRDASVTLFKTDGRIDAIQAELLLNHLRRGCLARPTEGPEADAGEAGRTRPSTR